MGLSEWDQVRTSSKAYQPPSTMTAAIATVDSGRPLSAIVRSARAAPGAR
jgi:hypothetical protein